MVNIPYKDTTIAPERTKADIEKLLRDHGVQDIQWTTLKGTTTLRFLWQVNVKGIEKEIMFEFQPPIIPVDKRQGGRIVHTTLDATAYRLLWHYLKNKLEAVRWGMETMEKEFLSHAVVSLPNGQQVTVGEHIQDVYETVRSPALGYTPPQNSSKVIDV